MENIPCLLMAHALVYWSHVNISTLFNQSEALWLTEGFTCPCYPRSCSDIALQGAFWPTPDTHALKHTFRMCHETSLLISSTPKHTDTHISKVVLLNTSRLIKTDSWLTAGCLCLAVSNWRLPPLVLMCKLQSSQTDSCYRRGTKTQRRWCSRWLRELQGALLKLTQNIDITKGIRLLENLKVGFG